MKVAIIGGGASGMMAAISAAEEGFSPTIFEKNESLGKKILLTGNGRCNISNSTVSWKNYNGTHPRFAASALNQFSQTRTRIFFQDLGLVLKEEDAGRLFPRSDQAQSVVEVLKEELKNQNVKVLLNQKIRKVNKENDKFKLLTYQGKEHKFDKLIIATGGRSYPSTGSTGDGYRFAKMLGHNVVSPFPASVPLRISHIVCNKLQGIKLVTTFKILYKGKTVEEVTDELLFTHLGLSAPAVLRSSRAVSKILYKNPDENVECSINFFPEFSQDKLIKLIKKRIESHPNRQIGNQFIGMLPKRLAPTILKYSDFNPDKKSTAISTREIDKIVSLLTDFRLKIDDILGWKLAQFTAGGIDVKEINPKTLQSKKTNNLYFCGEVIDIDGESGGYNLQWAWSSGFVAGHLNQ